LQYSRAKRGALVFACVPALGIGALACGDSGGAADDDDSSEMSPATAHEDYGEGDPKEVITIGDSWMNLNNMVGIQQSLEKASGRDYRNYGVPGTKLLDEVIPNQYEAAKKEGVPKTVIMTAGGNDILQDPILLISACLDPDWKDGGACAQRIDEVAARLTKLWAEMALDGVQDVFIIGYSQKTNPFGLGTTAKSITYSNMKIPPICEMVPAPLRCTALDTDMTVPDLTIRSSDGIHPTDEGYDLIGKAIWDVMQSKGMRR
jgi:lysophospholipase L1-like esterase